MNLGASILRVLSVQIYIRGGIFPRAWVDQRDVEAEH